MGAATFLESCKRLNSPSPPSFPVPFLHLPIAYSLSPGSKKINYPTHRAHSPLSHQSAQLKAQASSLMTVKDINQECYHAKVILYTPQQST